MLFSSSFVRSSETRGPENQRSSSIMYRVVLAKSLIALSLNLFTWKLQDALIDSKTFASSEMATYQWQDTAVSYFFHPRKEPPPQNWEVAGKILNHTGILLGCNHLKGMFNKILHRLCISTECAAAQETWKN